MNRQHKIMKAGVLAAVAITAGGFSAVHAQGCPPITASQDARSVDPNWPAAYYNKFPMLPDKMQATLSELCVQTPQGFSAKLWASENPAQGGVRAPIAIAFDERGRVWVAESFDYPHNLNPQFRGQDRIIILEDRNGDGMADTLKVFADSLNLVTGLVHTPQGLVVSAAPRILLFKDENGDDVADNPGGDILYQGFNRNDTHGSLSNLTYGLDNWVYGIMGYNNSTVNGVAIRGGIWRARPDGSAIEMLTPTSAENTWGMGMTETGQLFYGRANRDHSRHLVYPSGNNAAIPRIPNYSVQGQIYAEPHPVTDHWHINNPGYSSASNHNIYTARHFPEHYWDRAAFICESPRHLCHTMFLDTVGSTWVGSESQALGYNIFASTDPWSAPIQALVGPDGAVWVVDWYNYLLSHNWYSPQAGNAQVSPIRDNQHSRIYRVVYDGRPLDPVLDLSQATENQLLSALHHPNLHWRLQAQRLLLARGPNNDVVDKLTEMLSSKNVNSKGESPHVIHALWTLHGFGTFASVPEIWTGMIEDLLLHPSPGVRWNTLEALPNHASATAAILGKGRINDPDAHVRVRALHRLSTLPGTKSGAMYTPYVTRDAHSQNRFNAVGGLTQSASMPSVPPLYEGVSIRGAASGATLPRRVSVQYREGSLAVNGLTPFDRGAISVWNLRGELVARVPVAEGMPQQTWNPPQGGTYLYRVDLHGDAQGRTASTGRFTVLH